MAFSLERWCDRIKAQALAHFGERLLFLGLQGSWRRGEARPGSDVDLVLILDQLAIGDLDAYRDMIAALDQPGRACGFISGRAELQHWDKGELFTFYHDTRALYGQLAPLLPTIEAADIHRAIQTQAGALYHAACHSYLFEDAAANLPALYKSALFLLRERAYLNEQNYYDRQEDLAQALASEDRAILRLIQSPPAAAKEALRACYEQLIRWAALLLRQYGGDTNVPG